MWGDVIWILDIFKDKIDVIYNGICFEKKLSWDEFNVLYFCWYFVVD